MSHRGSFTANSPQGDHMANFLKPFSRPTKCLCTVSLDMLVKFSCRYKKEGLEKKSYYEVTGNTKSSYDVIIHFSFTSRISKRNHQQDLKSETQPFQIILNDCKNYQSLLFVKQT